MKKLLLTCTDLMAIQFLVPHVKHLSAHGFSVELACSDVGGRMEELRTVLDGIAPLHAVRLVRSPFSPINRKGYGDLKKIIDGSHWDVIWTNEPVMGVMTRLAAKKARKRGAKVIYMAHGFHFYKGAPKKNWLIWYPVEKLMCRYTDELITITQEDYDLATEKFPTHVARIHGVGANSAKYRKLSETECAQLRRELGYAEDERLLLCTGELLPNKNQITAIRATDALRKKQSNVRLLLAGNGPTLPDLQAEVTALGLREHVDFLGYRTDLERYANIADVIVSCSYREGLPMNIVEGMLLSKPVVASCNRGHRELVVPDVTGYMLPPTDAAAFAEKIAALLNDGNLSARMGQAGYKKAQLYADTNVRRELQAVYKL